MTDLFCIMSVSDRARSLAWFEVFFGRPADDIIGEEALWQIGATGWVVVDDRRDRPGCGEVTIAVTGLDTILARLAAADIPHEPVETYSNGVRHVVVADPDGNRLALAEPPAE